MYITPKCVMFCDVDVWEVGVCGVPHASQNTLASIESYHGATK
jgi:hypothetical protein